MLRHSAVMLMMKKFLKCLITEHSSDIHCFKICVIILASSFIGVMAMKRRIRRKRAAQALASSSSSCELEVTNNHNVQRNM